MPTCIDNVYDTIDRYARLGDIRCQHNQSGATRNLLEDFALLLRREASVQRQNDQRLFCARRELTRASQDPLEAVYLRSTGQENENAAAVVRTGTGLRSIL